MIFWLFAIFQIDQTNAHDPRGHRSAAQAQDFRGALYAIGLRMPSATEASVEQAKTFFGWADQRSFWALHLLRTFAFPGIKSALSYLKQAGIGQPREGFTECIFAECMASCS